MGSSRRVLDYVRARATLDLETFVRRHPHPVLVHDPDEELEDMGFVTRVVPPASEISSTGLELHTELDVIEVKKRPGAAFPERISVGRTPGTDVTLAYPGISKYHALVTVAEEGRRYQLTDTGSKNGTEVNGELLTANQPIDLEDGSHIAFAEHLFRFQLPAGLFHLLTPLAGR